MAEGGRSVGSVSVSVVPDATGFVERLKAELEAGSKEVGSAIGRNIGQNMADSIKPYLDEIKVRLDELGAREIKVKAKVDDQGSIARTEAELAALNRSAASGGNGFSIFGGKIAAIGLAAVAAADIAIPAILAIGAAAAGALAGLGVLGLGFSGIGAALEAHGKPSGGGGGGGGGGAALGQQSARISAAQATQSAQDQLTQAIEAQTKAETGLHDARVQALQDLQDLDNKLKDNTLSQSQAAINLKIAQQTLAVTLNAPGANQAQYSQQVAQARLNVAAAQQKVNELTLNGTRLAVADAKAHKDGVNGAPSVVSAQQALIDANHKLAEAQANIGITAQKNAIALQQAALAMAGAAGGADQFATAMAKLNPIQRQFVEFLISMKPLLEQIKLAASQFLPGLEQGIKNAAPAFGPILQIIGNIAKAMGSVFANIGAQFATPQGQKFLAFLSTELPKQIIFLGNLFIGLGKIVSGIFEAAGPLIAAFDQALLGALGSTGKAVNGSGLKTFFATLIPLIKPTFQALGALGGVIVSIMKALAPALPPVLSLITELANAVTTLVSGPVGQLLVKTFIDLVQAVEPLVPVLLNIIQTVLPPLLNIIDILITSGLAPLVQAIAAALTPILPPLGKAITALVTALAPFLIQLIQGLVPILGPLSKLFIDVLNAVTPLYKPFGQLLTALTPLIKPFADLVISLLQLVDKLLPPLTPLIGAFAKILPPLVSALKPVIQAIADIAQAIEAVVTGVEKAISAVGRLGGNNPHSSDPGTQADRNKWLHDLGVPGYAAGTSDAAGGWSWVGENGPELLNVPKHAKVYPHGASMRMSDLFRPQIDGGLINAIQSSHSTRSGRNTAKSYTFNNYGQSDPVATAHQVANRFAARGV